MVGGIVCSSSIAVPARCLWGSREGVVLSQNLTDPHLGMLGLQLLAEGYGARNVLERIVAAKPHAEWRQLAVLDIDGHGDVYTGSRGLGISATAQGRDCVAAGNLLAREGVPQAMVRAFEAATTQPLAARLLFALEAGAAAGGEAGSVHSAGFQVYHGPLAWPIADLRIDWSGNPIAELAALWQRYAPQMDDYVLRAEQPERAPSYGVPGDC
jgi:uncharacterized Ntn-hydrolase superfamily protein